MASPRGASRTARSAAGWRRRARSSVQLTGAAGAGRLQHGRLHRAASAARAAGRSAGGSGAHQGAGADRAGLGHDRAHVGAISCRRARRDIEEKGVYLRPSDYGDGPYPITRAFIEDGRRHLIGAEPFDPGRPVHILHGLQDPDVPWEHTLDLVAHLTGDWTRVSAVPDGEHRLSRPEDIALLLDVIREVSDGRGRAGTLRRGDRSAGPDGRARRRLRMTRRNGCRSGRRGRWRPLRAGRRCARQCAQSQLQVGGAPPRHAMSPPAMRRLTTAPSRHAGMAARAACRPETRDTAPTTAAALPRASTVWAYAAPASSGSSCWLPIQA